MFLNKKSKLIQKLKVQNEDLSKSVKNLQDAIWNTTSELKRVQKKACDNEALISEYTLQIAALNDKLSQARNERDSLLHNCLNLKKKQRESAGKIGGLSSAYAKLSLQLKEDKALFTKTICDQEQLIQKLKHESAAPKISVLPASSCKKKRSR